MDWFDAAQKQSWNCEEWSMTTAGKLHWVSREAAMYGASTAFLLSAG